MSDALPPEPISIKMVMLGDSGVGKTCLVSQWSSSTFDPEQKPTVGAMSALHTVHLNGKDVDVFLWDTAGQEQYSPLTPLYLRQACVAILTVSVDLPGSFDGIEHWLQLVSETCDGAPPVILAVNKMDLKDESEVAIPDDVKDRCAEVFFVSAKTGLCVSELFKHACEKGCDFAVNEKEERERGVRASGMNFGTCC